MANAGAPDRFEPLHAAHAIEQVIFSLQFQRHLDDAAIANLQTAGAAFAEALPAKNEIRSIGFAVGPQGFNPLMQSPAAPPDGFTRLRVAPTGEIEKELKVDRGGIVFRTTRYTRWANIWAEARDYFVGLLKAVPGPDDVALIAFSLQYVDKFVWTGDPSTARAKELFDLHSRYVSPAVFEAEDLWHSHFGTFRRHDERTKRLVVSNADCIDEPDQEAVVRRCVRVTTVVTDMHGQPGYTPYAVTVRAAAGMLDDQFVGAHNLLKDVISDLVNEDVGRRVGLETK